MGLFVVYLLTDPFRTLNTFNLKNVSIVNRDYLSTELFLKNNPRYHYNSFIFCSSRGGGINTYLWKSYLPKGAKQFLFQAWSETISGTLQKVTWLNEHGQKIENAIVMIDIPSSFSLIQQSYEALSIKHYLFADMPFVVYQFYLFKAYVKPSEVIKSIQEIHRISDIGFDSVSNDWNKANKYNWKFRPDQNKTLDKSKYPTVVQEKTSTPLINKEIEIKLKEIEHIFSKQRTNYKIIITPAFNQIKVNPDDLKILQRIYSKERVFNFSGHNQWTVNKYNFTDINHFDLNVGYDLLKICYQNN